MPIQLFWLAGTTTLTSQPSLASKQRAKEKMLGDSLALGGPSSLASQEAVSVRSALRVGSRRAGTHFVRSTRTRRPWEADWELAMSESKGSRLEEVRLGDGRRSIREAELSRLDELPLLALRRPLLSCQATRLIEKLVLLSLEDAAR